MPRDLEKPPGSRGKSDDRLTIQPDDRSDGRPWSSSRSYSERELQGFSGVGNSVEDCLYKAKWGMRDHVRTMRGAKPCPCRPQIPARVGGHSKRAESSNALRRFPTPTAIYEDSRIPGASNPVGTWRPRSSGGSCPQRGRGRGGVQEIQLSPVRRQSPGLRRWAREGGVRQARPLRRRSPPSRPVHALQPHGQLSDRARWCPRLRADRRAGRGYRQRVLPGHHRRSHPQHFDDDRLRRGRRRDRGSRQKIAGEGAQRAAASAARLAAVPGTGAGLQARLPRQARRGSGEADVELGESFSEVRCLAGRDQPAGRDEGRQAAGDRRQDQLRRQRPVPSSRNSRHGG